MFRLKVTLVLLLLVSAGAYGAYHLINDTEDGASSSLVSSMQESHLAFERLKKLRDLQLKDLASALSQSELGPYLAVLEDHRKAMLEVEREAYKAVPGDQNDEVLKADRIDYVRNRKDFLSTVAGDLGDRIERARGANAWQEKPRKEFEDEVRESLANCNAYGVNNCAFRFVYYRLKELVEELRADNPYGLRPDLVIVTDHRDVGLANADEPKWSDKKRFGADHLIIREVRKGKILRDIITVDGTPYFVTAAPIFESGKFRGSVLAGVQISKELVEDEKKVLGRDIGYVFGRKLVRTTLESPMVEDVRHNVPALSPSEPRRETVETDRVVAHFVPLLGNLSNNSVRAVVVANRGQDSSSAKTWIVFGAALLFLFGLLAMMGLIHQFLRPALAIDAGIHEISGGNKSYWFPADHKQRLWSSMAHSLNGMVANLTGRDLEREAIRQTGEWQVPIIDDPGLDDDDDDDGYGDDG